MATASVSLNMEEQQRNLFFFNGKPGRVFGQSLAFHGVFLSLLKLKPLMEEITCNNC